MKAAMPTSDEKIEHSRTFGKEHVTPEERDRRMRETFRILAPHYDRLCDIMTLGLHRRWRRALADMANAMPAECILDVAGGSGETAKTLMVPGRQVIVVDFSLPMLLVGRSLGLSGLYWVAGSSAALPFPANSMDAVTIAFGLRNVTYVGATLREVLRVLRPGGCFYCLEVSQPWKMLRPVHHAFCRYAVPRLGLHVTHAERAFDYLVESIHGFPGHDEIRDLMEHVGFRDVHYRALSFGIACIHIGSKA